MENELIQNFIMCYFAENDSSYDLYEYLFDGSQELFVGHRSEIMEWLIGEFELDEEMIQIYENTLTKEKEEYKKYQSDGLSDDWAREFQPWLLRIIAEYEQKENDESQLILVLAKLLASKFHIKLPRNDSEEAQLILNKMLGKKLQ